MISPLFKKLNFKAHKELFVMNAPASFMVELDMIREEAQVFTRPADLQEIQFALLFVIKKEEIERLIEMIAPKFKEDVVLWFAYPKGTSKNYKVDFNRDNGWDKVLELGYDTVRMVAIDEDWSALRFRKTEYIQR